MSNDNDLPRLPVFYSRRMSIPGGVINGSPSPGKPDLVVEDWKDFADVFGVSPVTMEDLYRVHDPAYVDGVLSCTVPNGFGTRDAAVAHTLPFTSGALLDAASYAIIHPEDPAPCAPVSGFHHAGYAHGGGFCTFNGLMVTAAALVASRQARRVGILDCDMHYGDGTDAILHELRRTGGGGGRAPVNPARWLWHVTIGRTHAHREQAQDFLVRDLPGAIRALSEDRCEIILYQAGADPHVDDPFGGWLTTEELAERDRIVFEGFRKHGVPVAWCLAGGYQFDAQGGISPVLKIHRNTAMAARRAAVKGGGDVGPG